MTIHNVRLETIAHLTLTAFFLAAAVACGGVERADDRSRGAGAIQVVPEQLPAADATGRKDADGKSDKDGQDDTAGTGGDGQGDDGAAAGGGALQAVLTSAGLRNFEQINATMAAVTGVPMTTPAVRTLFRDQLATSLPTDNDVKAFLGSHQVAVFKLAVQYCESLVADQARRTAVFGNFNFAASPAAALGATGKAAVADALVSRFWGKDLESLPPHAESVGMVESLIEALLTGKSQNAAAVTSVIVTGACSAVLAGAPVTMF